MDTFKQLKLLTSELKKVRDSLKALLEEYRQQSEANRQAQENYEHHPYRVEAPLEIRLEANQAIEQKTQAEKQDKTQKSIRNAAWAAFISASIYAVITLGIAIINLYQLSEARRSTAAIQGQLAEMKQQRQAWVGAGVLEITGKTTFTVEPYQGKNEAWIDIPFRVTVKNSGATPAVSEYHNFAAVTSRSSMTLEQYSCEDGFKAWHQDYFKDKARAVFPGQEQNYIGSVHMPLGSTSIPPLISVMGCIIYVDVFGKEHHTQIMYQAIYGGKAKYVLIHPPVYFQPITGFALAEVKAD